MATFHGTNARDIINGLAEADTIFGNGDNDRLIGNGGNDTIRGGSGQDIIEGNAGNDVLFADSNEGGEDVLFGGADSDILVSGTGRDHFNGGDGIDAASWQESSFGVTANIGTGRATAGGIEDTFTLVENLIGSRFGDTLSGNSGKQWPLRRRGRGQTLLARAETTSSRVAEAMTRSMAAPASTRSAAARASTRSTMPARPPASRSCSTSAR